MFFLWFNHQTSSFLPHDLGPGRWTRTTSRTRAVPTKSVVLPGRVASNQAADRPSRHKVVSRRNVSGRMLMFLWWLSIFEWLIHTMINFVDAFLVSYLYAAYPNGGLLKWGVALFIIHFGRIFHEINHPATGVPLFAGRPTRFGKTCWDFVAKPAGCLFIVRSVRCKVHNRVSKQVQVSWLNSFHRREHLQETHGFLPEKSPRGFL